LIPLREYASSEVELDEEDLQHLLNLVRGEADTDDAKIIQSITPTAKKDTYRVRPGGFLGRLGLPSGETIDIESRFPLGDVIDMLRFSGRLPIRLDRLSPAMDEETFILDVIALAYAREVERVVSFGLAKGYREFLFDRPPYPGIPDLRLHLGRYAARPDKLVTRARRITVDIDLNRALAAAIEVLSRVRLASEPTRALMSVFPAFGRVTREPTPAGSLSRIGLTRLTSRYAESLAIAEVILRGQSLAPEGDPMAGASVLFNMPRVWEACVAKWVQMTSPDHVEVTEQHSFDVTADGALRASADVTAWDDGHLVGLYDAKYKWAGETPTMGDVYQMVTYCTRLNIDEASLVYPAESARKSYRVGDVTVHTVGLDVAELLKDPASLQYETS
jgi:5-methylcytosine-specific restriction endonuclease McrBC regulatory subunit McrC